MSKLTREERDTIRAAGILDGDPCPDCGGYHLRGVPTKETPLQQMRSCPRVKRKVWHPNGNLIEIEFWQHNYWDDSSVIYPEDAYETEEPDD
jgi:hypothetical protein